MPRLKLEVKKTRTEPKDYGTNLYVVKVPKSICENEEILVRADGVVVEDNTISFLSIGEDGTEEITLSLSTGNWKTFYLADEDFQFPVSVERWQGVAGVKIIETQVPAEEKFVERKLPVYNVFDDHGTCKFCNVNKEELIEETKEVCLEEFTNPPVEEITEEITELPFETVEEVTEETSPPVECECPPPTE